MADTALPSRESALALMHEYTAGDSLRTHMLAVDELTGLITATALVRPTRSVHEVEARSVRKKMKDKAFARAVSREDVVLGAAELGVDLDVHIQFVIEAMCGASQSLGLAGVIP